MKAVLISLFVSLALSASCASSKNASSETKGGREVGGIPPKPNIALFRTKATSDLTADQHPAMQPIFAMINKGVKDNTVCASRQYQDTLVFGGNVAPYIRVVFRSNMDTIIDQLKKELDLSQVEVMEGGADDCRTQLTEDGSFTDESSKNLIKILQGAKVPSKNQGSPNSQTYLWTTNLACTVTTDPKGGSPFPLSNFDCSFGKDNDTRKVSDQGQAKLLVDMAHAVKANFVRNDSNGKVVVKVKVDLITCQQSSMELVGGPNGAPFSRLTMSTCKMKP